MNQPTDVVLVCCAGLSGKYTTSDQVMVKLGDIAATDQQTGLKSLNVPAVSKLVEHRVKLHKSLATYKCIECKQDMTTPDHFK